jgi:hypothetical protein
MPYWQVPRLWAGRTVAVLASGPSMSAHTCDAARGLPAIAVNNTFRLAPWADMLYAADEDWWRHNQDARQFAGLQVSVGNVKGVHRLRNTGALGFDADPTCVKTGSNSGYQAVHIAIHGGAERILLFGFDLRGSHWHGDHPEGLRNTSDWAFANWRQRFAELAPIATRMGVAVINCTPASALDCFPRCDPLDALRAARRQARLADTGDCVTPAPGMVIRRFAETR